MIKASALTLCSFEEKEDKVLSALCKRDQNIVIEAFSKECELPTGIENLAYKFMRHDSLIREYIISLRENYNSKRADFHFSLGGRTDEEKKTIIELFEAAYGIITLVHYCPENQMLNGRISLSSKACSFILGQYMEIALYKEARAVLEQLSQKHGKSFELYRNVKVRTREGKLENEFDLVIESSDGMIYVIEIKSGHKFRDFEKYVYIGKKYGIIPDRFLLVSNCLTKEECECGQYFNEYFVSNLEDNGFSQKLIAMIEQDI